MNAEHRRIITEDMMTLPQAADFLGLSARTLKRYVAQGQLEAVPLYGKPGWKHYLLSREDVEALGGRQ